MKRLSILCAALGLSAALGACGQKPEEKAAEAPAASAPATSDMNMGEAPASKTAKGTGTVTAIDAAAGSITLDHAPIPEVGWPQMTMAFKATPAVLQGVKVGDTVAFDLAMKEGSAEITSLTKR